MGKEIVFPHRTAYTPSRSQQIYLSSLVKRTYDAETEQVVVHFVLEDSMNTLHLQIERRIADENEIGGQYIRFERVKL